MLCHCLQFPFLFQGCRTIFHCATEPESNLSSGKFYRNEKISTDIENLLDKFEPEKIDELWNLSMNSIKKFI